MSENTAKELEDVGVADEIMKSKWLFTTHVDCCACINILQALVCNFVKFKSSTLYALAHYTVYVALHTGMSYMYVRVKAA